MMRSGNSADFEFCLKARDTQLQAALFDQFTQLFLKFGDVLWGWVVACGVRIEAGPPSLIEHPDCGFTVAERDFSANESARQRQGIHGGANNASGNGCGFFFLFRNNFRLFDQLDCEVKNQKTGVHVGEDVVEIVLQVALQIGQGCTLAGPLFKGLDLGRSKFAGAEHATVVNDDGRLPSLKTRRLNSFEACHGGFIAGNLAVHEILKKFFGFDEFREGQEAIIRTLSEGRSALAVFPTGGGKSLCYQVPALMFEGLTLVVSPLIALMKDQVDALSAKGIAAARLDSTLTAEEVQKVFAQLETGSLKLLYIAPERFSNEAFRQRLKRLPLALVAIDEAHCISEWGHNFRPDYLKLAKLCRALKVPRVLCLTATATPKVARAICKAFRIARADHVQLSFHRQNLELRVTPSSAAARKTLLLERLKVLDGAAVVYVTRQETAEEVATFLAREGLTVKAYHAGLPTEFRAAAQSAFMLGEVQIIVATIAFGMGIDKSNIRAVYHYNLPKSLENYTQEIGRGGRDGAHAICELLACSDDLTVLENFVHADHPSPRSLVNLIDRVLRLGQDFEVSPYDLSTICDIRANVVATVMTYLEIDGILETNGSHFATYRLKLLRTGEKILAGRAPTERKLLQRLLAAGELKRWWWYFYPAQLAVEFGSSREKIVALLSGLEAAGDAIVKVSGVRHRYRLKKAPGDLKILATELIARFEVWQQADLARLAQILGISAQRGCLTRYVMKHFGEKLDEPCGHCDRCAGVPAKTLKRPKIRRANDAELLQVKDLVDAKHAALATPRQLARFLCGMASPAVIRARLTRHPAFAILADLPFAEVLVIAEVA
jgi:ATP-dependent DNA helicase RecQ